MIAASDAEEEQAVKLRVRDAVLDYLRPRLSGAADAKEAREILRAELAGAAEAAAGASGGREVTLRLGQEDYPARVYGGFTLPAGRYESLRVVLGPGQGHNWWCVVFPTLCLEAAETEELRSVMRREDYAAAGIEPESLENTGILRAVESRCFPLYRREKPS